MNEQYQYMHEWKAVTGGEQLGVVASSTWTKDPKRLLFSLSRYKFTAKMLEGKMNVIEAGCGDGWASKLVARSVGSLTLSDYDEKFVSESRQINSKIENIKYVVHDFVAKPLLQKFDAFYCLDVLEHISATDERAFIDHAIFSCTPDAVFVFGMPSLQSQSILEPDSRDPGHINCKTKSGLKETMLSHFSIALMFSMNDEVVHTGHDFMSHYILAVCAGPKNK